MEETRIRRTFCLFASGRNFEASNAGECGKIGAWIQVRNWFWGLEELVVFFWAGAGWVGGELGEDFFEGGGGFGLGGFDSAAVEGLKSGLELGGGDAEER